MSAAPPSAPADPLSILREYRALAPWGLRDLAALAGGILDASGVVPVNAAARARPSERTIRFYVARGYQLLRTETKVRGSGVIEEMHFYERPLLRPATLRTAT